MIPNSFMAKQKKLLVVEDEQYLRDLYVQILKQAGFEVEFASNGEEGYEKMLAHEYDLVVLDIILPSMDGLQVLDKLEKQGKKDHSNVILLTNLGQDLVVAKALAYGVRGYMVKSDYTPEELVTEIKNYLSEHPAKSHQ